MKRPELIVQNGPLAGRRFTVTEAGVRLGRSSSNDIPIPDERLSRNHCIFEISGEGGVKVTDLASANGTVLNGELLGAESAELKAGDVIEVGETTLLVAGDGRESPPVVDLGLGPKAAAADEAPGHQGFPLRPVLWGAAVAAGVAALVLVLRTPIAADDAPAEAKDIVEVKPAFCGLYYEKVQANAEGIFRYALSVSSNGCLSVELDDTKDNRHPMLPSKRLEAASLAALAEMLAPESLRGLDVEYVGTAMDDTSFSSLTLQVFYSTFTQAVVVVNVQEPERLRNLRERLETFSQNELGINAIQYPTARLVEMAEESVAVGATKWEDRDAQYGNVADAVQAYREALFYLQTVEPKPACAAIAQRGLKLASEELDRRVKEQRFIADKALNLGRWEEAARELKVLLEMVPDRKDERNREASMKLLDVEKRLKEAK